MKDNINKNHRMLTAVLIALCSLCVLGGGYYYLNFIQRSLVEQAIANVLTVTQQQEQAFDNFLARDMDRIHSFAQYFSRSLSSDEQEIQEKLTAFDDVDAYYTVVNLENGRYYGNKTKRIFVMPADLLNEYQHFTDRGVRNSYKNLYVDRNMFGYYERFMFADGTPGLFQKGYDNSQVSDEFSLSFYDNQGMAYVTTQEGAILMRSETNEGGNRRLVGNIFDLVSNNQAEAEDWAKLRQDLLNNETGALQIDSENGTLVFTYVPVHNTTNWYLISIVPLAAIMDEADNIIFNSQVMYVALLVILLMVSVAVWVIIRTYKNFQAKNREIAYQEQLFNIFFTYLSNNTDDVYIMLSRNGNYEVEYVSPNVDWILGVPANEVREDLHKLGEAEYLDGRNIDYADLDRLAAGESLEPLETRRYNQAHGEYKYFREMVYCAAVQNEEKIIIYIADRTRERATQDTLTDALDAARLASRAKSTFLSSISHDIRTPMNAIVGLVTLLRDEADDPERVVEYTQRIDAASKHLLGLINDVLDMNKIESGSSTLHIEEMNLADIIAEVNTIIRPQAKAKEQEFQIFASAFTHEHLLGDQMRINQILINILSNAVKYTQVGGEIKMTVSELPQVLQNYTRIQIVVQDNGQGMSPEYQKVIFDPFTREQKTTINKIQGTGLGMAITKSIVDLMGGSIKVESQLGKGSTFTVELELRILDKQQDKSFWQKSGLGRMLVVDDDSYICQNVVQTMTETGVKVDSATSGARAVEMVDEAADAGQAYDLILLDWKMPEMDGLETARRIRQNRKHKMPILMLTAYDWEEIGQKAIDIGIDHFLQKPFFLSNFKDAIEQLRGGKEAAKNNDFAVIKDKHILVVEDIEVNRMILVKILTSRGARCTVAENGRQAVDMFVGSHQGDFDLILMV